MKEKHQTKININNDITIHSQFHVSFNSNIFSPCKQTSVSSSYIVDFSRKIKGISASKVIPCICCGLIFFFGGGGGGGR